MQYHVVGAAVVVLNYLRYSLVGYRNPRPFSNRQFKKAIDYDFLVVERWINYLCKYLKESEPVRNKIVLELGPGPDLGTGLIMLARGAKEYIALDVNRLADSIPVEFYDELFKIMKSKIPDCDINHIKEQLAAFQRGDECQISYVVDENFRISKIKKEVDIVISQAAFEHFDDVSKTLDEIGIIIKKGGALFSHVDLKTHSRWIKDTDPLNIYRYSDLFWGMFKFKGSPNRLRIREYKQLLEANNWHDTVIEPTTILEEEYTKKVIPTLNKRFRDMDISEMNILSFIIMSKKK